MVCVLTTSTHAQIGIYTETPDVSSALDISSTNKGMLLPSMTTILKLAITLPEHSLLVYDTDQNCISQNLGSTTAPQWTCLTLFNRAFFYMPSITIPTSTAAGTLLVGAQTVNLYTLYQSQFLTPGYKNTAAPANVPTYTSNQLYYYVTYHDPSITINSISDAGIMNYRVNSGPNYDSYANVVFVVK